MSTSLTIGGASVALPADVVLGTLTAFTKAGYPSLEIYARTGKLPASPDPYLAKEAVLTVGSSVVFRGDVASATPEFNAGLGWVIAYSCHGSAARLERIPYTFEPDGTGTGTYNAQPEDPSYNAARAGRSVGQIVADVLTSATNAANLTSKGIGNLSLSGGVYSLPTATTNDLAALTRIPNGPVIVSGEKLWHALYGLVEEQAPNHMLHVEPAGDIRVLDLRSFADHTFTLGTDPVTPSELSRDCGASFPRVLVRGAPIAVMGLFKVSNDTLLEKFAWGSYATNAAAEAAWSPDLYHQPGAQDSGTCSCPDTTHVTVNTSNIYASDYWDQTSSGAHGVINLYASTATGVTSIWTARIVANTSTSAGSMTVTIDSPLPALSYDHYTITGLTPTNGSVVWRRYQIADSTLWAKTTSQSTFPQPFVFPGGAAATLTSTPMGAVFYPISGSSPPYNMFPLPFVGPDNSGYIYFNEPTYVVAQNAAPADVWALIPINTSPNQAAAPADVGGAAQYSGTSHTVEGISDTLVVSVPSWRDPANLANMEAYAQEILDAVSNTVVEGVIQYLGLFQAGLTPGLRASVAGNGYTTGWESAQLPVVECSLTWNPQGPTSWTTTLRCTNRRSFLGAEAYLRPARAFVPVGGPEGGVFGGLESAYAQAVGEYAGGMVGGLVAATQYTGEIPTAGFVTPEAGRPESRTPEEQRRSHHDAAAARQARLAQQRQAEQARVRAARAAPAQEVARARAERRERESDRAEAARREQQARAERVRKARDRQDELDRTGGGMVAGDFGAAERGRQDVLRGRQADTTQQARDRLAVEANRRREAGEQERAAIGQRNVEAPERSEAGRQEAMEARAGRQEQEAGERNRIALGSEERQRQEARQRQEIADRNRARREQESREREQIAQRNQERHDEEM